MSADLNVVEAHASRQFTHLKSVTRSQDHVAAPLFDLSNDGLEERYMGSVVEVDPDSLSGKRAGLARWAGGQGEVGGRSRWPGG